MNTHFVPPLSRCIGHKYASLGRHQHTIVYMSPDLLMKNKCIQDNLVTLHKMNQLRCVVMILTLHPLEPFASFNPDPGLAQVFCH